MCSKSARRRTRSWGWRRSDTRRTRLSGGPCGSPRSEGLRDCQTLAPLGATALEDEASILRAHAFKEAMRLPAAAAIGLKSALHGSPLSPRPWRPTGRTTNGKRQPGFLSTKPASNGPSWRPRVVARRRTTACGIVLGSPGQRRAEAWPAPAFLRRARGGTGRFSTIVEISVENSGLSGLAAMKNLVVSGSAYGEGPNEAVFTRVKGLSRVPRSVI